MTPWQAAADALLLRALAPLGRALGDHLRGERGGRLLVRVAGEPPEALPVAAFFRPPSRMGAVDRAVLELARGRVLDVGACAGAHAVPLARRGHAVTALEPLPAAAAVLLARGVPDVRRASVWSFHPGAPYDTVLALMNGTALAGTLGRFPPLLGRLREVTAPGGQLLLDSTEVGDAEGDSPAHRGAGEGEGSPDEERGALELHYQLEYRGRRGRSLPAALLASGTLARLAAREGWSCEVVARQGARYLARLEPSGAAAAETARS